MRLNKNIIGLILGPLLFLVIMIFVDAEGLSFEAKCILASTTWMAVWWVTECVPISVTALLPIVLFPLTGGMDLATTTAAYGHKLVFLFVGGFLIALAIEKWHLHKRLALNIIRVTGSNKSMVLILTVLQTTYRSITLLTTLVMYYLVQILIMNGDIIDMWQFKKKYWDIYHTKLIRLKIRIGVYTYNPSNDTYLYNF